MSDELNKQLLTRLDALATRYDAITTEMSDPATASNSAKIVRLAKEHHNLGRLVEPYRAYRDLLRQLDETRAMADDASGDAELREMAREELPQLESRVAGLMEELIAGLLAGDDANVDSIIMEIRAGTGGDEAALFAGDLFDIYSRYAAGHGFKIELIDASPGDHGGYREVIFNVKGPGVYTHLGYEGGGHRVQRVPATETQGRIHTSAATVAVLPEVEETEFEIDWDKDVLEHVSAAGGPGGQNVNKVASAIKLEHKATGITVSMRDERSQHKNRAKARRLMISRVKQHYDEVERAKRDSTRKSMIGSGDRSERIRTYNFPQNRCTDHRVNESFSLEQISNGELDEVIAALRKLDHQQRLVAAAAVDA
ncbi:Peptide chain release factor RF1 [Phycisphaerae bacterium RAS2]|nr:Peptide chain release factor RF1 [Phycisphaerae bacterium RAS2]